MDHLSRSIFHNYKIKWPYFEKTKAKQIENIEGAGYKIKTAALYLSLFGNFQLETIWWQIKQCCHIIFIRVRCHFTIQILFLGDSEEIFIYRVFFNSGLVYWFKIGTVPPKLGRIVTLCKIWWHGSKMLAKK